MRPRCRLTAVLLGGWLLMIAPGHENTRDPAKPVSQWVQMFAYDTAADCEAQRVDFLSKAPESGQRLLAERTRCVPAEHIYPPATKEPTK